MKALVQAFWLLTSAIGDSIIVGIAAANIFSNMAIQFLAYAGMLFPNRKSLFVAVGTTSSKNGSTPN